MIETKHLTKTYRTPESTGNILADFFRRQYRDQTAVDDISFSIGEGELVGFIGPNGAGKTTTMKMLSGILHPTSGSIKVMGQTPFDKTTKFLRNIAFVMGQKNQMLWELPALDTFRLNKEIYELDDKAYIRNAEELIELLECRDFITQPVKTLSLGQRMRVELIGALLHKPKVLFLDEPTIGLDIFAQTTIIKFIKDYQARNRTTIMLTSHYMRDVQRLASRMIVIDHGRIIFDGKLKELLETYSQDKRIVITLNQPIDRAAKTLKGLHIAYRFPELRITIKKSQLHSVLTTVLKTVDYSDVTIEDEDIEDVIKKIFKKG